MTSGNGNSKAACTVSHPHTHTGTDNIKDGQQSILTLKRAKVFKAFE